MKKPTEIALIAAKGTAKFFVGMLLLALVFELGSIALFGAACEGDQTACYVNGAQKAVVLVAAGSALFFVVMFLLGLSISFIASKRQAEERSKGDNPPLP